MKYFFICLLVLVANSELLAGNNNAEVLDENTSIVIKHNTLYESYSVAIKINNSKGDNYSKITIYYSEDNPIRDFAAWMEDANGNKIRDLAKKEITDRSNIYNSDLFDDNCSRDFQLTNTTYPYVIKYRYNRKKKEFFTLCRWTPIYDYKIPTLSATLVLDIPKGYKINTYEWMVGKPVCDSSGKMITYTWKEKYEKIIKPEIYSPSASELWPTVSIAPTNFKFFIKGNQTNWASFGNWVFNLNKGLDNLPQSEVQKINDLTKGISEKKQIIKVLYQYMQDKVRYISVQVGIGGYKSYPAEYVCTKGYGDCKALANYMKALLNVKGIPAYCALIYADRSESPRKIIPDFIASQFNHVILCVPLNNDTIWLECTVKNIPCGYLNTFTQNRYALVINENKSRLVRTPAIKQTDFYTISKRILVADTMNGITLTASDSYSGDTFDYYSSYATQLNKDEQTKYLYSELPYQNFEIKKVSISDTNREVATIKLNYQILLKNNLKKSGDYWIMNIGGPRVPHLEAPSKRLFPVTIAYPENYIDSSTVILPDGFTAENIAPENRETIYGQLKMNCVVDKNRVEVYRKFLINPCNVDLAAYPEFYKFINSFSDEANLQLNLKKDE